MVLKYLGTFLVYTSLILVKGEVSYTTMSTEQQTTNAIESLPWNQKRLP